MKPRLVITVPVVCIGLLIGAALAFALGEPVVAQDKSPSIRFPLILQAAPSPPTQASKLTAETLYVIDADVPILVLASPQGLVSISMDEGPIKIRGRFVDGSGKVETRTYKGKQVYTIEAVATGTVELLIVPVGAAKESEVLRKTLQVDAQNPQPPPKPPDPKPPGPPPIPLPGLRVLIVFEEMEKNKLTAGQKEVISGAPMRDFLDAKCVLGSDGKAHEYRIWDKDVPLGGAPKHWRDAMSRGQKSIPWIVVSNGTEAFEGPLPATADETKKLILQYAE